MVLVLSLLLMTAILLFTNPRSEPNRWAGSVAFFSVLGELTIAIDEKIIPAIVPLANDSIIAGLEWVKEFFYFLALYMPPYSLLMFSLSYAGWFQRRKGWKRSTIVGALIPVLIMFLLPSEASRDTHPIPLWAMIYYATAAVPCLRLAYREVDERIRQQHRVVCWIVVPSISFVLLFDYILPLLRFYPPFDTKRAVLTAVCICFYVFVVRYGVLGVRIRLESTPQEPYGNTPLIFQFYHALKSELGKIQVAARRIFNLAQQTEQQELYRDTSHLIDATERIIAIAFRFRHSSQQLVLYEQSCIINELVEQLLDSLAGEFCSKNLKVRKKLDESIVLYCDSVHVQQVMKNLFYNAIEAMSEGGCLTITSNLSQETMDITVRDSGCGIAPEAMPYIFEPHFTTKSNEGNDGLGLFYSHEVMRHHQGSIEVQSLIGIGTSFTLHFPIQRVIRHSPSLNRWEGDHEQDQSTIGGRRSGVERIYIRNGESGTGFVFGRNGSDESQCNSHCQYVRH
ncbi:HAMP domain-containing sensor histidine kinase [Paenibacillus phoenicis]|uniref:histidine kinase n=1 Tax=Paenibacillus phoenicis TaxID=554117 RepID=A0ABU5PLC4_9BACL|nr:HAMP domain-containing sensor histidine kinase [Paenibacillus phoenicis]MEA3570733.1 HAMP domain-containing sensor histidine kinase [Paenibacillus phoenicis]